MNPQQHVITCQGGSSSARLAAEVARALVSTGAVGSIGDPASVSETSVAGRAVVALDGCASACGSRLATARGIPLVAALNLAELGVRSDDVELADPQALAMQVASRLASAEAAPSPPPRPQRHGPLPAPTGGQAHTVEDYLLAIDTLASPIVECGALVTDAPTLASHVSDALGVSRAAAGEMLKKMESSGLVRRGSRKELLLSPEGRAHADASVHRHRLLEVFATRFLGYELTESYERARMLGGAFDDGAIARLERRLGYPERCPHGWPVDPVRAREESWHLRTLSSLPVGECAHVARLPESDAGALRPLTEHEILPDAQVVVTGRTRAGDLRLDVNGRAVEVRESACRAVLVSPVSRSG